MINLRDLQSPPQTPFQLFSPLGDLQCVDVLRFLPGKRIVVRALLEGEEVIAKCFFSSHGERDKKRELRGIDGFMRASLDTPQLIGEGSEQGLHFVVTKCLKDAVSFDSYWQQPLSDEQRRNWLVRIARLIGALHNVGVRQKDFHLDNLLLQGDTLYLIDGGCVDVVNNELASREAINNLALFQAVLYPRFDRFLKDVWQAYGEEAPELADGTTLEGFASVVQGQRKWRERFVQKALRNCTQFRVEQSWRHFLSVDKSVDSPALRSVLANPEAAIAGGRVIKKGTTNTVAIITLDSGEQVLIKRFKSTKGALHQFFRGQRQSRARSCWLNGLVLEMLGSPTPQPMAMLEQRWGPLTRCSYVFNAYHSGTTVMDWFMQSPLPEGYQQIAEKVGDILFSLQRALVFHGDLKGNNFLLVDGEPLLIDLDAMTSYKKPSTFCDPNQKDINRFAKNWLALPEAAAVFSPIIETLTTNRDKSVKSHTR